MASSLAFSCSKKDDDAEVAAASSAFLGTSDLAAPAETTTLSLDDFKEKIAEEKIFYNNEPEEAKEEDAFGECIGALTAKLATSSSELSTVVEGTVDASSCLKAELIDTYPDATFAMTIKTSIKSSCTGGASCKNGTLYYLIQSRVESSIVNDGTTILKMNEDTSTSQADGTSCVATVTDGTAHIEDSCQEVVHSSTEKTDSTETKYRRAKYKSIVATEEGKYYSSGSMDVVLNNFSGTATFSAADTAPALSFKSADGTEEYTGTWAPSSSLALNLSKKIAAQIKASLPK